jgi:hypothetical protein
MNDPTPAGFLAARLQAAAATSRPSRRGWYRFAVAILDDSPERLEAFGAAVSESPTRNSCSPLRDVSSPHG